ncbi:uncharacterized protein LOC131255411 [Magnolia sinica]|uniref:uncharacterized protein LOC131255411 n=1 Tax=Magnolia sinica TaxID=86752 RepID=UPI00265AD181|nr:uncharacterized protein LOC131255411 [Magnolia sinica]
MRSFSQVRRCRSCTPLASVNRDGDDDDNDILARRQYHNRRSFSYHKLPQQLLKLSVLKLDGSRFEVQISRTASVLQLKQAVEEVFRQSPKEGEDQISWSHVWGHFCLSYEGKKLINDKESLQTFGVKDGDQLHFIRHLSINYNPIKRRTKYHRSASKHSHAVRSGASSNIREENGEDSDEGGNSPEADGCHQHHQKSDHHEKKAIIGHVEFKLVHFLKGRLTYSRLWCMRRKRTEERPRPSKFVANCLRVGLK